MPISSNTTRLTGWRPQVLVSWLIPCQASQPRGWGKLRYKGRSRRHEENRLLKDFMPTLNVQHHRFHIVRSWFPSYSWFVSSFDIYIYPRKTRRMPSIHIRYLDWYHQNGVGEPSGDVLEAISYCFCSRAASNARVIVMETIFSFLLSSKTPLQMCSLIAKFASSPPGALVQPRILD